MMNNNPSENFLQRFHEAQAGMYEIALREIKAGRKISHWMWYIYPQLKGLGRSPMAKHYGIENIDEARAYLADNLLSARLYEAAGNLLLLDCDDAVSIFGDVDAMKLRSSMTLFAVLCEKGSLFHLVLDKYFGGEMDPLTLGMLGME